MALKIITPAAAIVSLQEAKRHCRVDHEDDNEYLDSLVAVATGWVDGRDGVLWRSVGEQTWDYVLDEFPRGVGPYGGGIRIPLPPLQSVTGVYYVDPVTEIETTLAVDQYSVDTFSEPGWVVPGAAGWPQTMRTINAVRIRFVAGFVTVPPTIKHAILLLVGHLYQNRESTSVERPGELPHGVDHLLMNHRIWMAD